MNKNQPRSTYILLPVSTSPSANDEFHLATSEDVKDTTGKYFINRRTSTPPPPAQDKAACARLWGILEGLSGFKYDT